METSVCPASEPLLRQVFHSRHSSRDTRTINFFSSSIPLPYSSKSLCMQSTGINVPILRCANNFASDRSLCTSREYGASHLNCKLGYRYKLSRYIAVRSELAKAGTPGAAYPLPGLQLIPKIRGFCFYVITAVAAVFLIVPMIVAHPFVLLWDRHRRKFQHFIAKCWAGLTITPFYRIEFEGLANLPAPNTPAVYVSNHQSFLDIYTLLTLGRSFKFISKTAIFLFPLIGWAMFMMGAIPLKRLDSKSQLECLKRCMDLLKKGASVFFFPEGTRSKDGKLGAFKKGAFSVAAKTRVPVVPITLLGTGKIMPVGMEGVLNPGLVKVYIHEPIKGTNPDTLCHETRRIIAELLSRQGQ